MSVADKSRFNAESTCAEVLAGVDLSGKLAVVTGAGGGLGRQTALALAQAGADVVIGGRSRDALDETTATIADIAPKSAVHAVALDLASAASVDAFADAVLALDRPVDILVANAGIMATPLARNDAGLEMQMATNFIGHALLVSRLATAVKRGGAGRIVSLSSAGHHFAPVDLDDLNWERRPYDQWRAYGQSKTACALLAVKVGRALSEHGVTALAVHPGVIKTGLMTHLRRDDYAALQQRDDLRPRTELVRKSLEQGAATSVWAATAPELAGRTAYLEDCGVARRVETPDAAVGVLAYAQDPEVAEALWSATEALIGRPLPL